MRTRRKLAQLCIILLAPLFLFVACSAQSDDSTSGEDPENTGGSTSAGNPITSLSFDLTGAIGLALDNSSASGDLVAGLSTGVSNLKKVKPDNSLSDAVASGSVTVQSFMVAANNQVYLLLSTAVEDCILVRVDGTTNEATCVDPTLSTIGWNNAFGDPIQFDGEGNIYYEGDTSDGHTVLRENSSDETTDLINDNISLTGFLVLSDGTVFVAGSTDSTGTEWTRIITPSGSLENILALQPDFMSLFPDDNIYYGASSNGILGVGRYLTASGDFDPESWISEDGSGAQYDCPASGSNCGSVRSILKTTSDKVYATVPNGNGQDVLVQYYPVVSLPNTVIADVTVSKAILTYLFLAGLDGDAANKLVLYDTGSDTETDLLGAEDIEVYHLNYLNSSSHQIVMFDGLRFSDNSYVLCQVDLTSGNTLTCSETGMNQLTDFQLFN